MNLQQRSMRIFTAFITATALVVAGSTSASASEADNADDAVQRVDAAVSSHPLATEASLAPLVLEGGALVSDGEAATVQIPDSLEEPIVVSPGGTWEGSITGLTVGLPDSIQSSSSPALSADGSAVALGDDVRGVVQPLDGGLRISTIIERSTAPGSYAYELPSDVDVILNDDGTASLGRTVTATDEEGSEFSVTANIGQVGAAWAVDANGEPVATHYEVVDSQLVQFVDHDQPGVAYPVVADPTFWWGWNIYASNTVVGQITKLMLSGVAAGVLASRITALIPGIGTLTTNVIALAAALLGMGAALINQCNWNGRGVYFGHTWVTGVLPFVPTALRNGYFCVPN
jgi:hypothetical protein